MGKGDNRLGLKVKQKRAQRAKKARTKRQIAAAKAAKKPATQ